MISGPLFLGVDLGTSSLKCGLFDVTGHCAGAARVSYPTHEWEGGAEQHCADWSTALATGVRQASAGVDRGRIIALGIGGHAPSPVFLDADLQPVCPVLPWFDCRSMAQRDQLLQVFGRSPETGAERLMVQVAARAMWLRSRAPGEFARAACFLHSGDYLVARLTGRRVMTSPRAPDVFVAAGLPPELVPEKACRPGEVVGEILPEIAGELGLRAAVRVVTGGLDSFLSSVGSGMREPGDACLMTGSSAVVAVLARPGHAGRFEWAGGQIHSRPTRPGGRNLQWAWRFAGPGDSFTGLLSEAARLRPAPRIHRRLAWLVREAQRDDREFHRGLSEMAQRHTPVEMFRLLLDAIFLSQRTALEGSEQQGDPVRKVRPVGGLAADRDLVRLQADVLGRAVEVPRTTEAGALGAAMLAATGLGHCTPREAASRMVRTGRVYDPREGVAADYDRSFAEIQANMAGSRW